MITFYELLRAAELAKQTISLDAMFEDDSPDQRLMPFVEDDFDRLGWERVLHGLSEVQLKVFICKFLGFDTEETVTLLRFRNRGQYYNVCASLKRAYNEQKSRCLDYN